MPTPVSDGILAGNLLLQRKLFEQAVERFADPAASAQNQADTRTDIIGVRRVCTRTVAGKGTFTMTSHMKEIPLK